MRRSAFGMTLVELLVVLSILAGLATMAAVNSAGLQDRRSTEDTVLVGEAVEHAWRRTEGLSFVSDFGELPNDIARLHLLFSDTYPAELRADGSQDGNGFLATRLGSGVARKRMPGYAPRISALFPSAIHADAALPAIGYAELTKLNRTFSVVLPCGWRGPYCDVKLPSEEGVALDGFGGAWRLQWENETDHKDDKDVSLPQKADKNYRTPNRLVSRGQDGEMDASARTGLTGWQDADLVFRLYPPSVSLTVEAGLPDGVTLNALHVYMYYPETVWPTKPTDDKNQPQLRIACRYFDEAVSGSGVIYRHLTGGTRAFFVWADTSDGIYWLPPRYLTLKAGSNTLKGFLRKAAK